MGAALAIRKRDEAEHEAQTAKPARRALGPSEKSTRGGSAVERLLAMRHGKDVSLPEERNLVIDVVKEELKAIGSAGSIEVPHIVEAVEQGHHAEAFARLVDAGMAANHAKELVEIAIKRLSPHLISHAHSAAGVGLLEAAGPAVAAAAIHAKLAAAVIGQARAAGRSDAMLVNYAQTFAHTVISALYGEGVVRPEHTALAELDEARAEAFHHAMALLRELNAQSAGAMATAIKQELGTATNARHAIAEMILAQHGKQGIVLHAGSPTP